MRVIGALARRRATAVSQRTLGWKPLAVKLGFGVTQFDREAGYWSRRFQFDLYNIYFPTVSEVRTVGLAGLLQAILDHWQSERKQEKSWLSAVLQHRTHESIGALKRMRKSRGS
jgi:hypothetical protein